MIDRIIGFSINRPVVIILLSVLVAAWGILVSPFDWDIARSVKRPVPIDAIPNTGENQQIVFTEWAGRSPQDIEDQISYPLTNSLMGIPGVKTVRSLSMFGFSTVYIIFKDDVDFYWGRSRILEKLSALQKGALPDGVQPSLGPDATGMGQVFWYTLEGRDGKGRQVGGWDLHELRTIQDWYLRYALLSAEGVSEVASVGGFVQEYQVDLDPNLMRARNVALGDVLDAVRNANREVGARTLEVNRVEYVVRGVGFVKGRQDIENAVIRLEDNVPLFVRDVADVTVGPALRTGILDKGGEETVGGIVVVRFGENPFQVIENVKRKIEEISVGLPRKTLPDGTVSQVRIVPLYDRTGLIRETLSTLETALTEEILITMIVVIFMVGHIGSSLLIAGILPLAVLLSFIAMKVAGIDANIVALSGIAIAVGTLVDMGIIITENIIRHLKEAGAEEERSTVILKACREIGGAVVTAISTTVVSFLPVLTLSGAEGKLFKPLAFTKTFALCASLALAITVIPALARLFLAKGAEVARKWRLFVYEALIYAGGALAFLSTWWFGVALACCGAVLLLTEKIHGRPGKRRLPAANILVALSVLFLMTYHWLPLGAEKGFIRNGVFVAVMIGGWLVFLEAFRRFYKPILGWCLEHKAAFLSFVGTITLFGAMVWLGSEPFFRWFPEGVRSSSLFSGVARQFPGLQKEFMPPLEEGSYLFMPSTMPHASITEALDVLQKQDRAIRAIPEVETVVGKAGRADSALDPAPVGMIETVVNYRRKYASDENGKVLRFRFDPDKVDLARTMGGEPMEAPDGKPYLVRGRFQRNASFNLVADPGGMPFRLWRPPLDPALNPGREEWKGVEKPGDIWELISTAAELPGTTAAARLQPISARMVMLQSGIRASMGIRISGPDLEKIQHASLRLEQALREVRALDPRTVVADRILGKPYLEIRADRRTMAQYGVRLDKVQEVIEFAVGGRAVTTTVEGRERYPVRVRYARELRDDLESIGKVLVDTPGGNRVPLMQLAEITYVKGPDVIKGENGFLVGYLLFDKRADYTDVQAVDAARSYLDELTRSGNLYLPDGVSYSFIGSYENQLRSETWLMIILPVALALIFIILYLQFNSVATSALVFSGIFVAWSGGFIMIWLYAQPWFLDFTVFGTSMRELFQVQPIHLSIAVWVGFLALFGVETDDGVVMATYLDQSFASKQPGTVDEIRRATITAGERRVRPCLMTTATTVLALLPVLTSTGKGADIMVPMAIPSFGGMTVQVLTMLTVPVIYCMVQESRLRRRLEQADA